ncbi:MULTISPECIES: D-alanyl-D-alanine carboxypeptidase family protein [unclassified Spirillospora]|uniref:M15 family metallopeptidase n=1 Tax=unclassified Spirillospora TaxID=2642701 RepID=UPI0037244F82
MTGRHVRNAKYPAPLMGAVLAGALAGTLALMPLDGGSGDSGVPASAKVSAKDPADRAERTGSQRAEEAPSEPPDDCKPSEATEHGYPNGRIPVGELCPLPQRDEHLRADAAVAFYKLNAAYQEHFGDEMCVRSSYRGYEKQEELYRTMPAGYAARPGNSKHGIGISVDLCDGVQDGGSPQFKWLEDNSEKYGWIHPAWAYSNPYEPWHWEFDVGQDD